MGSEYIYTRLLRYFSSRILKFKAEILVNFMKCYIITFDEFKVFTDASNER